MNGYTENDPNDTTSYWDYSMNINVEDIVYVHCHQSSGQDTGGTIILVGHDGVQRSPIIFPEGGHMASFLSCLETGLLPHGQLGMTFFTIFTFFMSIFVNVISNFGFAHGY